MNTGLQESIFDAVSILASNAAESTETDKTIECEIVAIEDATKGKYIVQYTENKFTAHSANGVTYAIGDSVYVLVPQGDFSKNKVILGSTVPTIVKGKQSGDGDQDDDDEKITQKKEYYDEIGDNLLVNIADVDLCTYHTEEKELEYDSHYLSDIIKNYKFFVLKADFRTAIVDIAQRVNGNYGLRLRVPAIKNGEAITIEKVLDITKMDGNVYNFEEFATQRIYFDFDGSTIDPERQITISAFVKDFMQNEDDTIPSDIFIKDINFKAVNALTNEDLQGYYLTIDVSEGYYFLDGKYTSNKILTPKLRIDGVFADIRDYECYWFKEDASIGVDSEGYNYRGGAGWRILNTGTKIGTNDDGTSIYDYNYKEYNYTVKKSDIISSARYKCVLLNSNIQTHGIVAITNLNSEITYSLNTISGSTTFVKDVGVVNLIAKLHYPNAIDNTTFDYLFRRYDKNGEYLDSEFYDIVEWDAIDGVDRTTQISFPVGNIDEFNIIKCEFVRKRVQNNDIITDSIGTSSITLTTGTNVFDYFLSLENNEYYYKYDANGNSPKVGSFDGPYESKIQEVKPIKVKVFKANGDELSTSEYNAVDMTWAFPKNSMMDLLGYDLDQLEQDDKYYYIKGKNIMSLSYDIKNIYNNEKFDNTILITAVFDDTTLKATADFTFKKDGESGTNGSKYSIVIKHEITDEDGIDRWYAYGERNGKGLPQKIRPVYVIDTWKRYLNNQYINFGSPKFKVEVYKNGKLLENTPNQEDIYSVSWEMFDPNYTKPCFGISNGVLSVSKDWNDEDVPVNIIKASVVIKESSDQTTGKEYVYGFYPIDIIRLDSNQKFIPEIAGGYSEVTYDSDGTNPQNNTNESFSVNVVDGLNNFYDCTWNKSDTLILEGKEADYAGLPFERDYRPISQLVDGQSKNYIKVILSQPAEKEAEVDAEAARLTQERNNINNKILYYTHEKEYLNTFLGKFSYDSFVNSLDSCKNYLTYRGRYLATLFDLVKIIDEIKNTDPEFDYSEQKEAINTIIQNIYNAESADDIENYTNKITAETPNQTVNNLISSFNENVDEGIRNYNNLIIYNNLSTELNEYNSIVNNIKALPTYMTDLCSAHDEGEVNEEFVKLRDQISIYGEYFGDISKGYTKKWIINNIFKPIEDLLAIYKNSSYIRNKYDFILAKLNTEIALVNDQQAAADQSHFSHAIVIKPIIFLLNRYGLAAINNWDGSKLYTGPNDEYLFAPQVGAGKKENGQFTGVVMGIRVKGGTRKEIGLIGKHQGQDSFFLDAETGNADFGVAGEGQIKMRPGGTSTIAQWEINKDSLSRNTDNGKVSLYAAQDNINKDIQGRYKAFEATNKLTDSNKKETYITYDGYLYTNDAKITGWITATNGKIGGWTISGNGLVDESRSAFIEAGNIHIEYDRIYSTGKKQENSNTYNNSALGFYISKNNFVLGDSSNYLKYINGSIAITNTTIGLDFSNRAFRVGNNYKYLEYTSTGDFTIKNSNLGLILDNDKFRLGNNMKYLEYNALGDFIIKHNSLGLSFTDTEFRVGQDTNFMRYTTSGGLTVRGTITADQGQIGPFHAGKSSIDNRQYIWTNYSDGVRNFILGEGGLCLGSYGKMYIGNSYIGKNIQIQNYQYNGGTIIHSNGGIQTDYLTIMQVGDTLPKSPVHTGDDGKIPKGIYMNLSQGEFASYNEDTGRETYPLQLRLIGCGIDNSVIRHGYIGLWSEGRLIVGANDYGISNELSSATSGHYRAMKASIDGALYVNKNIYCSFGEPLPEDDPLHDDENYNSVYRLQHKNVTIGGEEINIVYAKYIGASISSEGPDPVRPTGNTGGELPPPSDSGTVLDPEDPVYPYIPEPEYCVKFSSDMNFSLSKGSSISYNGKLEYSINKGQTWNEWKSGTLYGTAIQSIYIRGTNNTRIKAYGSDYTAFVFTGKYVSGNIETLLDYTKVQNNEHPPMSSNCFYRLFADQRSLIKAFNELPSPILSTYCYDHMFSGCTSLVEAPELPATVLDSYCYYYMFSGCTSLITSPELPATTLASSCYSGMLNGCTSLVNAPELPAIALANNCYSYMFSGCASLTTTPELPATTLASSCYSYMFKGCTSLVEAPELPATSLTESCYTYMFNGCTSLVETPELPATTLANYCYSYMFDSCALLINVSELPATTLAVACYQYMFRGCTSLTTAPELPATTLAGSCYQYMFSGCTSLRTPSELPATTLAVACYVYMFNGCTSLTTAPELPATKLAESCYKYMFNNCTSLVNIFELPASTLAKSCYSYMFNNCASLTNAPELLATRLAEDCCSYMFNNCTSLTTAPELPATTLADYCYQYMFNNCTSLMTVPELPASRLTESCYYYMFNGCTSLVTELLDFSYITYNNENSMTGMFQGCTSLENITLSLKSMAKFCCTHMFEKCSSLKKIKILNPEPFYCSGDSWCISMVKDCITLIEAELLIQELCDYCYDQMFDNCISLKTVHIDAIKVKPYCFRNMFHNCISLESCFELPATKLADYCYSHMFEGCTSLINAPGLPATTLASHCYDYMFSGCTSLTEAQTTLPANIVKSYSYDHMFSGCTSLTTAPEILASTIQDYGCNYMFENCESLTSVSDLDFLESVNSFGCCGMFVNCISLRSVPVLPASNIGPSCYQSAFQNCSLITEAQEELPASVMFTNCYRSMFSGCTSLRTPPELPSTTLAGSCYQYMFNGCISLTMAPELPATILANNCYYYMFNNCTTLTTAPELPATTLTNYCYAYMFSGCASLTTAPELSATTLADYCYYHMFEGCTSLRNSPELPAIILTINGYASMFNGCVSLINTPELPATTLAGSCYAYMFNGCTSLTTLPELPATTLANYCYQAMFYDCGNIKLSTIQNSVYQLPYRIPSEGTISSTPTKCKENMFAGTGGTFRGEPNINTTYYLAN